MIIAHQKRKENVAEYVLYMWQVEDLIRACQFNIEIIQNNIINQFGQSDEVKGQMKTWYSDLISMMQEEQVMQKGHVQIVRNIVDDMDELHLALLKSPKHVDYNVMFFNVLPCLAEFRQKSSAPAEVSDVELALNMMYEILLLRLQKREISEGTQAAVKQVSRFLAVLSDLYKKDENDELEME
ncbi:MAG: DUF4924 family protein [Paludibacteraceae bacterium]|nr:DUF4924 family protein [Paludibacteraceae bacterium]